MINEISKNAQIRMQKSVNALKESLTKLRTGRAHPGLLEHITVDYYNNPAPLSQVSNISVENARTLLITPWEKEMVSKIEKAIIASDLGLNPSSAGMVIRVPMPALTEERRKELTRLVRDEAEKARVAVRNIRREANTEVKELLKAKKIGEDDERRAEADVQKITDKHISEIDQISSSKEKDLMAV